MLRQLTTCQQEVNVPDSNN